MPLPTFVAATTAQSTAGTEFPTVAVPAGAQNGDRLVAVLQYAGTSPATSPAGWTLHSDQLLTSSGRTVVVSRVMSSGVTQAQWQLTNAGPWSKMSAAMGCWRGDDALNYGTPVVKATSTTTIIAPSITTGENNALVVGVFGDRVSSPTTATAPTGMTERAKLIQTGSGATTVMICEEARATAGVTGTRTANYGVATNNGFGVLIELSPSATTAPVVNAGADVRSPVSTAFSRTATATGTVVSWLWTKESGPAFTISGSTTATMSGTPATAGTYVFRATASDGTTPGFDEYTLYVTSTSARPDGTVTNPGNYAAVGGAGSLEASLADESDATYVESPDATVGAAVTFTITPLASGAVTVATKGRSSTTPVITMRTKLMQGSTVIATWDDVTTTSFATYSHTTTSGEAAAITDFNQLRVEYTWQS